MPAYAELEVTTNFSFLEGASHPEELVERAEELGLSALAVTDRNSLAGVVRAHVTAKRVGLRFLVGARVDLEDAPSVLVWPTDRKAYGRLCSLLTEGRRRAPKGACSLLLADLLAHAEGQILGVLPPEEPDAAFAELLRRLHAELGDRLHLVAHFRYRGDDRERIDRLAELAVATGARLLATNAVLYHDPARRPLRDVLTCIRGKVTLAEAGLALEANAERHLKSPAEMARLFARWPQAIEAGLSIVARCRFSLDELAYDYPVQESYEGRTPDEELARRVREGARERYPDHLPEKVKKLLEHELALVRELRYAPYFLTVHDIVLFARSRGILCQGRGSAANSAICYVLGITAVDPARMDVLFERFVSAARNEPPDIDVDFEHERREEVIQWVYETYGRDHAALAATVVRYRAKSALREVAKVMGLSADVQETLSRAVWATGGAGFDLRALRALGLDPDDPLIRRTVELAEELQDFPRHLSQHVGGFVIAKSPLRELVPIENAAMDGRTVVEWDKDDLDALKMLKIDLLALGMLSCIRRAFELLRAHYGLELDMARVPAEDPAVYAMLQRADSIGVFQVESRAQMSMLPRLAPRSFYDLVIEVAIVRPGPIQGDMVHPYLRRREGLEPVTFPSKELEEVLGKTLGVPLFQEQAMRIAIVAAGFTPEEADGLRRSMAAFRRKGDLERWRTKLVEGMVARGYDRAFAERCFEQIRGFGYYGFPESHAASFALLVYVSAWLKCHYPDVFLAAILNAQPMGFYAPAQLVRDAIEHGVEVRPVDVNLSFWDSTLEPLPRRGPLSHAVRLGLREIKGLARAEAARIVAARLVPYRTVGELRRRAGVSRETLAILAEADAFRSLGLDRRQALWEVRALAERALPLFDHAEAREPPGSNLPPVEGGGEPWLELPPVPLGEAVIEDYARLRLSLRAHPLALLRERLARRGIVSARELWALPAGARAKVAGLVLVRQRPGSARGVVFVTLEDETGFANLILWPRVFARFGTTLLAARLLGAAGRLQREGRVLHLLVERLIDLTEQLALLREDALDPAAFDGAVARADAVRHESRDLRRAIPEGRNFR
ncbi:MAG: error-prone DNA polymerase [Geminicoccaceae bacterium]|nr:error-prone DNA polymerase [Geminicoccaceae bacterium]